MTARNGDTSFGADRGAASQDRTHRFYRQFLKRHPKYGQRHDGLATHGVDIRDGIGGGDAAEVVRIIHHRHEEVGGGDDAVLVIDLPDGCIVTGFRTDEKLRIGCSLRLAG